MVPVPSMSTAPVPPLAYQRAVAKRGPALHIDALTLVTRKRQDSEHNRAAACVSLRCCPSDRAYAACNTARTRPSQMRCPQTAT